MGEVSLMLAGLAAAGLIMGFCFNGYALLLASLVVAAATLLSAIQVGFAQAGISLLLGLIVMQGAYAAGLFASALFQAPTRAPLPTAHQRE